jgi:uncharacterized repeat protein (TIGR03803 family)
MKSFDPGYALRVGLTVAVVSGCGGAQSPNGASGAIPPGPAITTRAGLGVSFWQQPRSAPDYTTIYTFKGSGDGAFPESSLIAVKGMLFGTTSEGGTGNGSVCQDSSCGTVFTVSISGTQRVLHSFKGYPSDGGSPDYGLTAIKNSFYGTTPLGGNGQCGTSSSGSYPTGCGIVFKLTRSGKEDVLYTFEANADGAYPEAGLTLVNGTFYGTTAQGGSGSCIGSSFCGYGTVFAVSPSGMERVLYRFKGGNDGLYPSGNLLVANGMLYGTAQGGAPGCSRYGCGIVFVVTASGKERVIYRFKEKSDGSGPNGGLVVLNGKLYGTTGAGGASGKGTVFEISTTGSERVLYSFKGGTDGAGPEAGLVAVNGALYGTTWAGGGSRCQYGCGTIFKITASGTESVLHLYKYVTGDAEHPKAALTDLSGTLYGTTFYGGGGGTVFGISP